MARKSQKDSGRNALDTFVEVLAARPTRAAGALRDVARVTNGAMRNAARREKKVVDRDAVERVLGGRMPIARDLITSEPANALGDDGPSSSGAFMRR